MTEDMKARFANIAARKLEKDRAAEQEADAKVRAEQTAEAQWVTDKAAFQKQYLTITHIIGDHAETLTIAGLVLRAIAPNFDDRTKTASITVALNTSGPGGGNSVSFNLRRGAVIPVLAKTGEEWSPDPMAVEEADREFYERNILEMMESSYPAAGRG